jgi:hypothetical protein
MKRKSRSIYFNISIRLIFRYFGFSLSVKQQVEIFSSLRLTATSWKLKTQFPAKSMIHLSATMSRGLTIYLLSCSKGYAEAHWLRYCATRRKFDGSIPDFEISHWFRRRFGLGLDSTSNRYEYQDYLLAVKGCRCHSMCVLCGNSGSLKLLEPSGTVQTCKTYALPLWDNKSQIFVTHYIQCSLSPYYTLPSVSLRDGDLFLWIKIPAIYGFISKILLHSIIYMFIVFTALKRRSPSRIFYDIGLSISEAENATCILTNTWSYRYTHYRRPLLTTEALKLAQFNTIISISI